MLQVDGIETGYGESTVLRQVSLEVPEGGVACLMGRNGAGKTTLVKAVMGLLPLRRGRVLWEGRDLARVPPHRRAALGFGYVPQGRGIFPFLTVRENLLTGLESCPRQRRAGVLEETLALFPRLREVLDRPGGTLSGGQQQLLALARALAGRPRLLLLDEPTEGLQPSIIDEVEDLIQALKGREGLSILLVEQRLDVARRLADTYTVLDQGRVVVRGTAADLEEEAVLLHLSV